MADLKTYPTSASVAAFLERVPNARQREDAHKVAALMHRLTGAEPRMWGSSIVGFGTYTYFYESGRSGDWPLVGFAPRAKELVLYITSGFDEHVELMRGLGRYKTGKACLYVRTLDDINLPVLTRLIEASISRMAQRDRDDSPALKAKPKSKAKVKAKAKAKAPAKGVPKAKSATKPRSVPKPKRKPKPAPAAKAKAKAKTNAGASTRAPARQRKVATRR